MIDTTNSLVTSTTTRLVLDSFNLSNMSTRLLNKLNKAAHRKRLLVLYLITSRFLAVHTRRSRVRLHDRIGNTGNKCRSGGQRKGRYDEEAQHCSVYCEKDLLYCLWSVPNSRRRSLLRYRDQSINYQEPFLSNKAISHQRGHLKRSADGVNH